MGEVRLQYIVGGCPVTLWVSGYIVGVRLQEIKRSDEIIAGFRGIQIPISENANPTFDIRFPQKYKKCVQIQIQIQEIQKYKFK